MLNKELPEKVEVPLLNCLEFLIDDKLVELWTFGESIRGLGWKFVTDSFGGVGGSSLRGSWPF